MNTELRKLIESTIREVQQDRKEKNRNAQTPEVAARWVLQQIVDKMRGTGLPNERQNPLSHIPGEDIYKEVALVCLEQVL